MKFIARNILKRKSNTSKNLLLSVRIKLHLKVLCFVQVFLSLEKENRSKSSVLQLEPLLQSDQLSNWKKKILQPSYRIVSYAILHLE